MTSELPTPDAPDVPVLRDPTAPELERLRWEWMRRVGRHGWAATGAGAFGLGATALLVVMQVVDPMWLTSAHGNGAWVLVLLAPLLGGAYRALLAQWDRAAERLGSRVSLEAWRGGGGGARTRPRTQRIRRRPVRPDPLNSPHGR